jgi:hypothetical protein
MKNLINNPEKNQTPTTRCINESNLSSTEVSFKTPFTVTCHVIRSLEIIETFFLLKYSIATEKLDKFLP